MFPRLIRRTLLLAVLVTLTGLFRPAVVEGQGPRAGLAPIESSPAAGADERVRAEGYRAARLSRGARGALIGMAIGAAAGAGLGYLACTDEEAEIPCMPVIPLFGAGGLVLGALAGYSVATDPGLSTAYPARTAGR